MKITLGIFAWNESKHIGNMIKSLCAQDIFIHLKDLGAHLDILCIPNGSIDHTAEIAEKTFLDVQNEHVMDKKAIHFQVKSIEEAGKANAWNVLIHQFADQETDYFFLTDADILFNNRSTLLNMLLELEQHASVIVSTDIPLKDIELKTKKRWIDKLLIKIGGMTRISEGQICGQLYCIRGNFARRIWMPKGLLIEDGFIKEMVTTDFLTKVKDNQKIVVSKKASHVFEAYTGILSLIRHQVRQIIGQTVYAILKEQLLKEKKQGDEIGQWIKKRNDADPDWLLKRVKEYSHGNYWVIHPEIMSFRLRQLKHLPSEKRLAFLPLSLLGFFADLCLCLIANYRLKHLKSLQDVWSSK